MATGTQTGPPEGTPWSQTAPGQPQPQLPFAVRDNGAVLSHLTEHRAVEKPLGSASKAPPETSPAAGGELPLSQTSASACHTIFNLLFAMIHHFHPYNNPGDVISALTGWALGCAAFAPSSDRFFLYKHFFQIHLSMKTLTDVALPNRAHQ